MRLSSVLYFYGRRLRTHPVQEVLAGLGIAIGVALVFAVQVANSSITNGSRQVVKSIVGSANLQLRARSAAGLDEHLVDRVRVLPGVQQAAPVLDLSATVQGPHGRTVAVQLVSANLTLSMLDGLVHSIPLENLAPDAVMITSTTARALGVSTTLGPAISSPKPVISLQVRGRAVPMRVGLVLGPETVGDLSNAVAVVAPLSLIQRAASLQGRVTRILVQAAPGDQGLVRRELDKLAAARLTVGPATEEVALLKQATAPNSQATGFFAFVSALVGMLLAFNAMLLSAPERRRVIADLRIQGARPRSLVKLLLFQSLCLGLAASVVGVLVGVLLSRGLFHESPGYLAAAFPLGTQTVIGWQPVVLSIVGGIVATCLAAAPPLLDLRRSHAVDGVYYEEGEPGHAMASTGRVSLFLAAVALLLASSGALIVVGPGAAVFAIVGLALAALLAIPLSFSAVLGIAQAAAARTRRLNMLLMATRALRATTVRSLALAATGAIAVFGSVAAEGSHRDLLNGLYGDYRQYVSTANLWVTNKGDELATNSFPAGNLPARISRVPGVAEVRSYQGGFFDVAGRRVWVIARSPNAPEMFPTGQIVHGTPALATRRVRGGGWITVSQQIAQATHVGVGGALTLPTPTGPVAYRVAATTSNLGWAAGAIVLNDVDYRHGWANSDPSALEVQLLSGAPTAAVKQTVEQIVAGDGGLRVQTNAGRATQADVLAREGLSRLTQISLLLMVAAVLAMAAAMGASIWQRRPSLASLRIESFRPSQLRVVLLCESLLVLGTGCVMGALAGIYGHELINRYLQSVSGFPAPFAPAAPQTVATVLIITAGALIVLAVPGFLASQVQPSLALQE
jgi:putative ABC transport system permease protein